MEHPSPDGPVLYVSPLRVMSPLPSQPTSSSNGFHPPPPPLPLGFMKNGHPRPSAVRDFPVGCGRNAALQEDAGAAADAGPREKTPKPGNVAKRGESGEKPRRGSAAKAGGASDARDVKPKQRNGAKKEEGSVGPGEKPKPGSANGKNLKKEQAAVASASKQRKVAAENAKLVESGGKKRAPVTSPPKNETPKNRKRNSVSATPPADDKKPRRSAGKAGRPSSSGPEGINSSDPRKAVVGTMRLYDALRRHLIQEEELKGKEATKGRADLNAGTIVNSKGFSVNRSGKIVGSVPGVEVRDQFYFRMEICCVGMHGPIQSGIEYLTTKESEWNTPVAISVISLVGHGDRDDGEELVYTGQGGKSATDTTQNEDQKLERGNLALDGSMKHQVPVRVIRGIKDVASPAGKIYTYDGLYKVEESWTEKGKGGFEELKFRFKRVPGQPELGSSVINLTNLLKQTPSMREGLLLDDISKGKESSPICVVNTVDDVQSPASFDYSTKVQYPSDSGRFESPNGCDCKGVCNPSSGCRCFTRNGNEFAYINAGVLVKEKDIIYECGSNCKCSSNCRNRLTQKGGKLRLEVFKTENRGWGVRSWDSIPAGSFICEYTGKVVTDMEAVDITNNEYLLDVKRVSKNKTRWGDVSGILESQTSDASAGVEKPDFIVDAKEMGNVARFMNHSCFPNVLVQFVLHDHHDSRLPRIMLFAMDNIPSLKELTLDYGCQGSEEADGAFKARTKDCLCGDSECRGKLYY